MAIEKRIDPNELKVQELSFEQEPVDGFKFNPEVEIPKNTREVCLQNFLRISGDWEEGRPAFGQKPDYLANYKFLFPDAQVSEKLASALEAAANEMPLTTGSRPSVQQFLGIASAYKRLFPERTDVWKKWNSEENWKLVDDRIESSLAFPYEHLEAVQVFPQHLKGMRWTQVMEKAIEEMKKTSFAITPNSKFHLSADLAKAVALKLMAPDVKPLIKARDWSGIKKFWLEQGAPYELMRVGSYLKILSCPDAHIDERGVIILPETNFTADSPLPEAKHF